MRTSLSALVLGLAANAAIAQVPCTTTNVGTSLGLTDETVSVAQNLGFTFVYGGVPYTQIQVCDNGYVTLGGSGGQPDWDPLAATLVGDPFPRICPLWIDLEPGLAGSGDVFFSAVPASGTTPAYVVVTWQNVWEYAGTAPHTFQLFLIDGGQVRCNYDSNLAALANPDPWLIGASPGNAATLNPVSFASLPILTSGNPTFHEVGTGAVPLATRVFDWLPDGLGGFTIVENTSCASVSTYGVGCIRQASAIYEHFATSPAIDLSNSAFTYVNAGSNYVVIPAAPNFVAPSATAQNLGLTDDSETTVTLPSALAYPGGSTTTLTIGSNGWTAPISTGAAYDYSPTVAEFLGWTTTAWVAWHDFIPNTTANVWYETVGGVAYVTWLNVISWDGFNNGTTPSTFQFQFDLATGNVTMVFQSMDTVSLGYPGAEGWVIGYRRDSSLLDPGSTDLSSGLPAVLYTTDVAPLTLACSSAPMANTTVQLTTTNIPAGTPFGAVIYGLNQFNPGISLAGFGMPGCFQYNDSLVTMLFFPGGNTSANSPFVVPNAPGLTITAQSAVFAPAAVPTTPVGALASNGLALHIN